MLDHLGKFTILERLGKGAMGEVYLGEDPLIGRKVAIKTIRADLVEGPEGAEGMDLKERFRREAQAAGGLNHPNLVTVHDFGEQDGLLYLVMERVPGDSLQALLATRALSPNDLLEVLAQVCDGLGHAHRHGIIHRDVKPANVMVGREDGRIMAKVMDFGVARLAGSNLTASGSVMGTVTYMAPEYLVDGAAGAASDQFAVGVMLWEGLVGSNPFKADTTGAVIQKIVNETCPPAGLEALPAAMQQILRTALARNPLGRYPSMTELAQALRNARGAMATGEEPTAWLAKAATVPARRQGRHRSWRFWGLGLVAVLAATLATLVLLRSRTAPAPMPAGPGFSASNAIVLDEAAKFWENKPEDALRLAESVLAEEPANSRAWALKLACLYHLNRLVAFGEALQASQEKGVQPADLMATKAFKTVLERDRERRKLPEDLRKSLLK